MNKPNNNPVLDRVASQLAEESDTIPKAVIAAAILNVQKEKAERQRLELEDHLNRAARNTTNAVEQLREARKTERKNKTLVDAYAAAEIQLQTNGNFTEYLNAVTTALGAFRKS